jgi:serine/threonine protein kinase
MAPEQFQGMISKEGDQYALGCIAYELVTGHRPFSAPDFLSLGFKHLSEQSIPPRHYTPSVPAALEAAILKAMAKQRNDRYTTISDFLKEFLGNALCTEERGVRQKNDGHPITRNAYMNNTSATAARDLTRYNLKTLLWLHSHYIFFWR